MKRMAFIIALAGLVSQGWGGWRVKEIVTFDQGIIAMAIEKGRNDDTNRLYCWVGNTIKEITYSEGWHITQVCSLPILGGMVLAKAHNDDTVRLYAVSDSTLWEFTFTDGKWKGISFPVVDHSVKLTGLLAGPARNDDTIRLYCGIPETGTIELTWKNDKWETTGEIYDFYSSLPTAIGKGRNDNIIRLYTSSGSGREIVHSYGMKEWTYTNGSWEKGTSIKADSVWNWSMGDGRNNSLMRIYGMLFNVVDLYCYILEFTYYNGQWKSEIIDDEFQLPLYIEIADGRNQNKNCVYVGGQRWTLYEYEWRDGSWKRDTVFFNPFNSLPKISLSNKSMALYNPLTIGKVRNDSNRIYYTPGFEGRKLLEITWEPKGIDENDHLSGKGIFNFSLYPNPFSQEIKIEWQGTSKEIPLNLEIYNAIGQKVRSFPQGVKTHSIVWDGKDNKGNLLPSGVYFCRFQTGGKSSMKKIVLKR